MRPFFATLLITLAAVAATVAIGDPAHRWTKRLRIETFPVDHGQLLVHPPDVDERELKVSLLHAKQHNDVVLLGSSRVMSVSSSMFDWQGELLNLGVSGASAEDYVALWEALRKEGKLPKKALLYVDPWVFNKHRDQSRWVTNRALVSAFLEEVDADLLTRAAVGLDAMKARADEVLDLLSWVSLRAAVASLRSTRDPYRAWVVDERQAAPEDRGTRWDGSYRYEERKLRRPSLADIDRAAREYALAPTVYSLRDFEVDPRAIYLLRTLIADMRRNGVDVLIIEPPYQPTALDLMRHRAVTSRALEASSSEIQQLAAETGVPVCDAMDPASSECVADEFLDGMHPLPSCDVKVLRRCLGGGRSVHR